MRNEKMLYDRKIKPLKYQLTIRIGNPSNKMLELLVVLDDCGDRVVHPLKGEGEVSDIVVRKPLDKVQAEHWRSSKKKTNKAAVKLNG